MVVARFEIITQCLYEQIGETQAKPRPGQMKPTKQRRNKLKLKKKMETNACKKEKHKKKDISVREILKVSLMRGLKLLKKWKDMKPSLRPFRFRLTVFDL